MKFISILIIQVGTILGACHNPVLRREIRELDSSEVKIYTDAINKLQNTLVPGKNYTYMGHFAKIHSDYIQFPHSKPPFLVWHRHFVRLYEIELQKMDPRVIVPYWDWTLDSQAPERSPILTPDYVGGNGNSNQSYCLSEGPFKNWNMTIPNKHCLSRNYSSGDKISPFSTPEEIHLYLNEPNYSDVSLLIEEKHAYIHNFIGGDLQTMYSPNDPIFFLLHTFVDLLFHNWQLRHLNATYEGSCFHKQVSLDDEMIPFGIKVRDAWDIQSENYCYQYHTYPRPQFINVTELEKERRLQALQDNNPILYGPLYNATLHETLQLLPDLITNATDTTNTINATNTTTPYYRPLSFPSHFPSDILQKIGFNLTSFRANTRDSNHLLELLNSYPNYISISHLGSLLDR